MFVNTWLVYSMDITTLFFGRSFKMDDSGRLSRGLARKEN